MATLINWKELDKRTKKIVALWSFLGLSSAGVIAWGTTSIYGLVKFQFEAYVQNLAKAAVIESIEKENDDKTTSLSYKLAREFDIDREDVPSFVAHQLKVLRQHSDSIDKFNRTLKPWALEQQRTIIVGPRTTHDGKMVYIDFDGEEYRVRKHTDGRLIWIDGDGQPHYVRY